MFYMSNQETNDTNNKNSSKGVKRTTTASEVINELSHKDVVPLIGDIDPGETIVRLGDTEHVIRAAPERTRDNTMNFIRKSNVDPSKTAAEQKARYQALVEQVAQRMMNKGSSSVTPDFDADVTHEMMGKIFADAKALVAERNASLVESREAKQAEFRRRLLESRETCPACHLLLGFSPDSLDNHTKSCPAYQEQVRKEQAHTAKVRGHQSQFNRLLNLEIRNAISSVSGVMDSINELTFDINEAKHSSKDPGMLEAWARVKEDWNGQSDYDRQRRMQALSKMQNFAATLLQFYDKLEESEVEEEVTAAGK